MGLEASKRGLFVQQTALYTTGHNISNANTLGYSRQRVNMQATPGFPTAGLNQPTYPGHLGTGWKRVQFNVFAVNLLIANIVKRQIS